MKRLAAFILAILMICCLFPVTALAAPIASGECGDEVIWEIDKNGKLTIRGAGGMDNYLGYRLSEAEKPEPAEGEEDTRPSADVTHRQGNLIDGYAPWSEYAENVKRITVEDGVTNIGEGAFLGLDKVTTVSLPESIYEISEYAFMGCASIIALYLPTEIDLIGERAFADCTKLQEIIMPTALEEIGEAAFLNTAMTSAHLPKSIKKIGKDAFGYKLSKFYYDGKTEDWTNVLLDEEGVVRNINHKVNKRYRVIFEAGEGTINYLLDKYNVVPPTTMLENTETVYASTSKKHGIYLRLAPSKEERYQSTLADEGDIFTVYAREPGFCLVVDNNTGLPGWVSAEYVRFEEDNVPMLPEEGPGDYFLAPYDGAIKAPEEWQTKYVYKNIATSAKLGLYLRSKPSFDWGDVFGMAPEYSKVVILAYDQGSTFALIYDLSTGQVGWVTAKYLR